MVAIARYDLEFILRQIKIAEAHSAGAPLAEIRIDANGNVTTLPPCGPHTVDGSANNHLFFAA